MRVRILIGTQHTMLTTSFRLRRVLCNSLVISDMIKKKSNDNGVAINALISSLVNSRRGAIAADIDFSLPSLFGAASDDDDDDDDDGADDGGAVPIQTLHLLP
jgi:hypothetical protein